MSGIFPSLQYIWITRRNKVRQAVSWWKALQTGVWRWADDNQPFPKQEAEFDFEAIDGLVPEIVMREASWQEYFASCRVSPCVVVSMRLCTSLRRNSSKSGEIPRYPNSATYLVFGRRKMKSQADTVSEEWVYDTVNSNMMGVCCPKRTDRRVSITHDSASCQLSNLWLVEVTQVFASRF